MLQIRLLQVLKSYKVPIGFRTLQRPQQQQPVEEKAEYSLNLKTETYSYETELLVQWANPRKTIHFQSTCVRDTDVVGSPRSLVNPATFFFFFFFGWAYDNKGNQGDSLDVDYTWMLIEYGPKLNFEPKHFVTIVTFDARLLLSRYPNIYHA